MALETLKIPTILHPTPVDGIRCGEIFVTNNADKWTFVCSYCQKAISDIGVFICHIRLDHLCGVQDFQPENGNLQCAPELAGKMREETQTPMTAIPLTNIFPRQNENTGENEMHRSEVICSRISKIVDISSLTDNSRTESRNSNKTSNEASIPLNEINNDFFNFLPLSETSKHHNFTSISIEDNKKIINVYKNDDKEIVSNKHDPNIELIDMELEAEEMETDKQDPSVEPIAIDDDDDEIELIIDPNENDKDVNKASGSTIKNKVIPGIEKDLSSQKCKYCLVNFQSSRDLHFHITREHDEKYLAELPHKCHLCKKGFKTNQRLKTHLMWHSKNIFQCPLCSVKKTQKCLFLQHVKKHESDKIFPCQNCGSIYNSYEERLTHWQTHAKDEPYFCDFCYRRFRKDHHLKTHRQHYCYFCPKHFVTINSLKPPYVCSKCEEEKLKPQTSLSDKINICESDEDLGTIM